MCQTHTYLSSSLDHPSVRSLCPSKSLFLLIAILSLRTCYTSYMIIAPSHVVIGASRTVVSIALGIVACLLSVFLRV